MFSSFNNKKNFKIILSHLNILYVEDEDNIRENISKTLDFICKSVYDVASAEEALLVLKTKKVDIIISDINLPKINGIELSKEIRKINKTIPILLLSAFTDRDYLLEATKLKLVDYLVKPIDFDELYKSLETCIEDLIENSKIEIDINENISYNLVFKELYNFKENKTIDISAKELELLEYMIRNTNRVIGAKELKEEVWRDEYDTSDSALKNVINKLRKKIGKESIKNISGVGYRIEFSK